jgi:hypothetical protein
VVVEGLDGEVAEVHAGSLAGRGGAVVPSSVRKGTRGEERVMADERIQGEERTELELEDLELKQETADEVTGGNTAGSSGGDQPTESISLNFTK